MKRLYLSIMVLSGVFLLADAGAGLAAGQSAPATGHASPMIVPPCQGPSCPLPLQTGVASPVAPAVPGGKGTVQAIPADDIRDIRGPLHIPDPLLWLYYAIGACLALATGLGAWRWFRGRQVLRAKRAFDIAFEKLEEARGLMSPETADAFSVAVSSAVRAYIEDRFSVRVTRHTTEEFMVRIQADPSGELMVYSDPLHDFLRHCDLAKFARCLLTKVQMEQMHRSAWDFVDCTRPRPEEKTAQAGDKVSDASSSVSSVSKTLAMGSLWGRFRAVCQHGIFKKATAGMELGAGNAVAAGGR